MIQIKLKKEIKEDIEEKHKKWYKMIIYPKLLKEIKEIKAKKDKTSLENKYLTFLKQLEYEKDNMAILSNEKMIFFIERYTYLCLDFKDFNEDIEKIKKLSKKEWPKRIEETNKKSLFYKLEIKEKNIYIEKTLILKKFIKIFDYDKFSKLQIKVNKWDRHKLMTSLNISVCPYCQRNYITSYHEHIVQKTTADLDHFYPQSEYPFLALSLYNFIPSCQICNSRMKGTKNTYNKINKNQNVVYPYSNKDFTAIFRTNKNIILELIEEKTLFEVKIENVNNKRTKEMIKMFKLDKIYKYSHNNYIIAMLNNIKNKPKTYLDSIADLFLIRENKELKEQIKKDLERLILEPYKFKIEKGEPLGKLTKDILEEFGVEI